ncbi:MAG: hypothetical protein V4691_04210 [Pseudomonadota bacterium]
MALLIGLLLPLPAFASDGAADIKRLEGVYKTQFKSGLVDGTEYMAEDIFEFLHVRDNAAYFKLHLEFYNAHVCDLSGIAKHTGTKGSFIFKDGDAEDICILNIQAKDGQIVFSDNDSHCNKYCGARGSISGSGFPLNKKRKIRYMPLILKSEEYRGAVENYDKSNPRQ